MEAKFAAAWAARRQKAAELGVRIRDVAREDVLKTAHRALSGTRVSEGFYPLADKGRLDLSLEALVIDKRYTALFSDEEADRALERLLTNGYSFK